MPRTKKRSPSSRAVTKTSKRAYSPEANRKVGTAIHEYERGELKIGTSGRNVKSREQAIAIGLSEARREGARVPAKRRSGKDAS